MRNRVVLSALGAGLIAALGLAGAPAKAQSLTVDESLLTGESDLIPKVAGDPVYSGSFCVSGSGAYVAEKVGADSLAGTITAGARTYNLVLTPLQHTTNVIIRLLLVVAGLYLAMVLIGAAIWDYPAQDTVIASAVVVGIVPTGLFLMITFAVLGANLLVDLLYIRLDPRVRRR